MKNNEKNVITLAKGEEKYIFAYDNQSREALKEVLKRFVSNPELSFSLHDLGVAIRKIRDIQQNSTVNLILRKLHTRLFMG